MVDEYLKSLSSNCRKIEADEAEMKRYRRRLAERMATPHSSWAWWSKALIAGTAAATLALLIVVLLPSTEHRVFPQTELIELQILADNASDAFIDQARVVLEEGHPHDRLNALYLLSLTENTDGASHYAALGVQEDPRPEFRFSYLEVLLDQADEYSYNVALIEQLMDSESDRDCLRLYRRLLRLTI
ncbi:MAG: hypothetical protein GY906_33520 [bacterium]|nr:hypothetical protein [bacterium]